MIAYIKGEITAKTPTYIYVEASGVGYHVNISLNTYSKVEQLSTIKILTYYHVKEDGQSLYGFFDDDERQIFIYLLSVSGIGPNTARVILSYMTAEEVRMAILQENVVALNNVKGIGPKTAKRIILDLKDKVAKASDETNLIVVDNYNTIREEALSALLALGFPKSGITKSIAKVMKQEPEIASVEDLIKKVLKQMS